MHQRKRRKVRRGVKSVVIKQVDWRKPTDAELLALALLDVVKSLPETERGKLAKEGQAMIERLDLKRNRDTDQQAA